MAYFSWKNFHVLSHVSSKCMCWITVYLVTRDEANGVKGSDEVMWVEPLWWEYCPSTVKPEHSRKPPFFSGLKEKRDHVSTQQGGGSAQGKRNSLSMKPTWPTSWPLCSQTFCCSSHLSLISFYRQWIKILR